MSWVADITTSNKLKVTSSNPAREHLERKRIHPLSNPGNYLVNISGSNSFADYRIPLLVVTKNKKPWIRGFAYWVSWVLPRRQEVDLLFIGFLVYPLVTVICSYFPNQTGAHTYKQNNKTQKLKFVGSLSSITYKPNLINKEKEK